MKLARSVNDPEKFISITPIGNLVPGEWFVMGRTSPLYQLLSKTEVLVYYTGGSAEYTLAWSGLPPDPWICTLQLSVLNSICYKVDPDDYQ